MLLGSEFNAVEPWAGTGLCIMVKPWVLEVRVETDDLRALRGNLGSQCVGYKRSHGSSSRISLV